MSYFSKESYKKEKTRRSIFNGILNGVIVGLVIIFFIVNSHRDLNEIRRIAMPTIIASLIFIFHFLSGKSLVKAKLNIIAQQERLLGFNFDHEMEKYQVDEKITQFENEAWFIDRTANSVFKDNWIYHIDFIREVDLEDVVLITGEVVALPDPIRFDFVDWLSEHKKNRPSLFSTERTSDTPYAPFVVEKFGEKEALIYQITGFKADLFESIDRYTEKMRGDIYDWEALAATYLKLKAPHLIEKIRFNADYKDGIFRLTTDDFATLEELATGFRDMCDDYHMMRELLIYDEDADDEEDEELNEDL